MAALPGDAAFSLERLGILHDIEASLGEARRVVDKFEIATAPPLRRRKDYRGCPRSCGSSKGGWRRRCAQTMSSWLSSSCCKNKPDGLACPDVFVLECKDVRHDLGEDHRAHEARQGHCADIGGREGHVVILQAPVQTTKRTRNWNFMKGV